MSNTTEAPNLAPLAALALPNGSDLATRAQRALAFVEAMPVTNPDEYQLAADELQGVKARWKALEAQRTGITGPINKALDAVNALFKGPQGLLLRAEEIIKGKLIGYDNEQRRIAAERQRVLDEAARVERERQAAEAERLRKAAEEAQAAAAKAAAAGDTAKADAEADRAQRAHAEAQAAAATAQMIVAPVAAPAVVKVKGLSTAARIDFEVTSLHDLAAHIVSHPELVNLLQANDTAIRAYVRGIGTACKLPGVRVFEAQVMRAGA